MAKFAVALLFLTFAGVTLGSTVDDLADALKAPIERDIKRCESLISRMGTDVRSMDERLLRNTKSMTSTIETELKDLDTRATRLIRQYPKKAKTIKSKKSAIEVEGKNHIATVNDCMETIVKNLTSQYNETLIELETAVTNMNRTLKGIKLCEKDNDYSTGRCTLRYVISRACDYLDGVTELVERANELHTAIELATVRMDNTCGLTKAGVSFRRSTAQMETDLRKTFHSG